MYGKPHVVAIDDKFYIRKKYLGRWDNYQAISTGLWFYGLSYKNLEDWCSYTTKEGAFNRLKVVNQIIKPIVIKE